MVSYYSQILGVFSSQSLEIGIDETSISACDIPYLETKQVDKVDVSIIITTRKSDFGLSIVPCQVDQYGRPTLLMLNVDPASVYDLDLLLFKRIMARALGMTKFVLERGFVQWDDSGSDTWKYTNYIVNDTVSSQYYLTSPLVKQSVQQYFQCESMSGALIRAVDDEYYWSSKIFRDELLSEYDDSIISSPSSITPFMTLTMLSDIGWYGILNNKNAIPFPIWGKGKGCSFALGTCDQWPTTTTDPGYLCPSSSTSPTSSSAASTSPSSSSSSSSPSTSLSSSSSYCTYDFQAIGYCPSSPSSSSTSDCPVVVATSNNFCNVKNKSDDLGEYIGSTARCFRSSLSRGSSASPVTCGCYDTRCTSPTSLKIRVDDTWYDCPPNGTSTINVIGFSGSLSCPAIAPSTICTSTTTDTTDTWPIVSTIVPLRGNPGISIQIIGKNFLAKNPLGKNISVEFRRIPGIIKKVTEYSIAVEVPAQDNWNSAEHFSGAVVVPIVIRTPNDISYVYQEGFTVTLSPVTGFGIWLRENPGLAFIIVLVFVLIIVLLVVITVVCLPRAWSSLMSVRRRQREENQDTVDTLHGGTVSLVNLKEVWESVQDSQTPVAFRTQSKSNLWGNDLESSLRMSYQHEAQQESPRRRRSYRERGERSGEGGDERSMRRRSYRRSYRKSADVSDAVRSNIIDDNNDEDNIAGSGRGREGRSPRTSPRPTPRGTPRETPRETPRSSSTATTANTTANTTKPRKIRRKPNGEEEDDEDEDGQEETQASYSGSMVDLEARTPRNNNINNNSNNRNNNTKKNNNPLPPPRLSRIPASNNNNNNNNNNKDKHNDNDSDDDDSSASSSGIYEVQDHDSLSNSSNDSNNNSDDNSNDNATKDDYVTVATESPRKKPGKKNSTKSSNNNSNNNSKSSSLNNSKQKDVRFVDDTIEMTTRKDKREKEEEQN